MGLRQWAVFLLLFFYLFINFCTWRRPNFVDADVSQRVPANGERLVSFLLLRFRAFHESRPFRCVTNGTRDFFNDFFSSFGSEFKYLFFGRETNSFRPTGEKKKDHIRFEQNKSEHNWKRKNFTVFFWGGGARQEKKTNFVLEKKYPHRWDRVERTTSTSWKTPQ